MKINSIKITNYKCFKETRTIIFQEGFNIITGINNSGKSSLLECLSLKINTNPHFSLISKPTPSHVVIEHPSIRITLSAKRNETNILNRDGTFYLPGAKGLTKEQLIPHLKDITNLDSFDIDAIYPDKIKGGFKILNSPTISFYNSLSYIIENIYFNFSIKNSEIDYNTAGGASAGNIQDIWSDLILELRNNIFLFKAERLKISSYQVGTEHTLRPDASNLPQILHNLQSNKSLFQKYNLLVSSVLPQVKDVSVHNEEGGDMQY